MTNNGYRLVTPVVDNELSIMQVYEYGITDTEATSSKYVSKEVVLQSNMFAQGLKVIMGAYRPAGTVIDVFARFIYPWNTEQYSGWIQLKNRNPDFYSTTSNIRDYREYTYDLENEFSDDLDEQGNPVPLEFTSFQIKIVLRHATDEEINILDIYDAIRGTNLFPHVYDYRAIALT
jgi:hypothetical protein